MSNPPGTYLTAATRRQLRREIAKRMEEPFFKDVDDGYILVDVGASNSTQVRPNPNQYTGLWFQDDEWKRSWVYVSCGNNDGQERRIIDYNPSTGIFTFAPAMPSSWGGTDQVEIHSRSTAKSKNVNINRALSMAYPDWFIYVTALIPVVDDDIEWSADTLGNAFPRRWRHLLHAWIEPKTNFSQKYTATAAGATSLTVSGAGWTTNEHAGKRAAIVDGTGQGQEATITSNTGTVLSFAALTVTPTTGCEFYIKDPIRDGVWEQVYDLMPQGGPYLETITLPNWIQQRRGYTVKLHGLMEPNLLEDYEACADIGYLPTEDLTTDVHPEYIINKAMSLIALSKGWSSPNTNWETLQRLGTWYDQEAEKARRRHGNRLPAGTVWRPQNQRWWRIETPFTE